MPGAPCWKKKSPTIAPITARPAAGRSPVKMAGTAAGASSLTRRWSRAALVGRHEVVRGLAGRLQPEERVGDHRKDRDEHADGHAGGERIAHPDADERH